MNKKIEHWLKTDHISFLLILPAIFINRWLAIFLWTVALIYDILEQEK